MMIPVTKKLDEDDETYRETIRQRSEAGKRGMAKRWNEKAITNDNEVITNDNTVINEITKITESESVYESESVNKKDNKDILSDQVSEIVDYLNEKLGTRYKKSKSTTSQIKARLDEGHTVDDFKTVIDKKVKSWKSDPKMSQYLRPETLFRPSHFESYLNEIETGRASPQVTFNSDMTPEKHAKIHNFGNERKIDYDALGAEFANV